MGQIQPAAAARAAGGRAVFLALLPEVLTQGAGQLREKWPVAHAGGVGLEDAQGLVNARGRDARTAGCAARRRVGTRDVGIGAEIDVEHARLGAFEQDALALVEGVVEVFDRVGDERLELAGVAAVPPEDGRFVHALGAAVPAESVGDFPQRRPHRRGLVQLSQLEVDLFHPSVQPLAEQRRTVQVAHANAHARHLVAVARTDASARGSQRPVPGLGQAFHDAVIRHDHMGAVGDLQPSGNCQAAALELVNLLDQQRWVHDHAVGDDARLAVADDPGRDQMEGIPLVTDDDGMAGVGPALVANDDVGIPGEGVKHLRLAFITPLQTDYDRGWQILHPAKTSGRSGRRCAPRSPSCWRGRHRCPGRGLCWDNNQGRSRSPASHS